MLAILAALTEVIKANGGKESSTEYFAALVSLKKMLFILFLITYPFFFFCFFLDHYLTNDIE